MSIDCPQCGNKVNECNCKQEDTDRGEILESMEDISYAIEKIITRLDTIIEMLKEK